MRLFLDAWRAARTERRRPRSGRGTRHAAGPPAANGRPYERSPRSTQPESCDRHLRDLAADGERRGRRGGGRVSDVQDPGALSDGEVLHEGAVRVYGLGADPRGPEEQVFFPELGDVP